MFPDNQEKLFKQWFAEYENLIFKVVKAYATSLEDQNDLFQEILLQLWISIPNFQGNAKTTTWIYRVALNTVLVWRRGQTRKRKRDRKMIMGFNGMSDIPKNPCNPTIDDQVLVQLYGAIRELSKIDSSLVLMYLNGVSYDEIAEILGISKSNVGVRLNRAKKQLAQLMKGLIDDV